MAFLTTVLAAVGPTRISARHIVPNLTAYHVAFLAAAAVALLAVFSTVAVSDSDAAATMVSRGRLARRDETVPVEVEVA